MSEEKIPTAKQVMAKIAMRPLVLMDDERLNLKPVEVVEAMIKFAKLHVAAALKAACEFADGDDIEENRDQILKAYPPENIM